MDWSFGSSRALVKPRVQTLVLPKKKKKVCVRMKSKTFPDKQKLRKFITITHALQEMFKEGLEAWPQS
jgi:stress-induced morphogen